MHAQAFLIRALLHRKDYNPIIILIRGVHQASSVALCCSGCHLMALASEAGILFHFLAWDFSDVAARTRGKAPGRYSVLPAQTCQHVNPQGNPSLVGREVGDKCCPSGVHSAQLLWAPGRTEPRMDYGLAALIFCFILGTLPVLFLGILSQNKYLWERPYVKVYFPFESQAKTLGTCVSALEQWW